MEKITEATGIKSLVKFIAGEDCGCDERKDKLNKLFPYKQPLCMTEKEYNNWSAFREKDSEVLQKSELDLIATLHARLFQHAYTRPCTCAPVRWKEFIADINQVYNTYEEAEN